MDDGKVRLRMIPNYYGSGVFSIDDKNRLKIPSQMRRILRERNQYNLKSNNFQVIQYNGGFALGYNDIPFAELESASSVEKPELDISCIDDIVYVSAGVIKRNANSARPDFSFINPDTAFLYSATDAQKMIYDPRWADCGFM